VRSTLVTTKGAIFGGSDMGKCKQIDGYEPMRNFRPTTFKKSMG
jgi:hypothetical protein